MKAKELIKFLEKNPEAEVLNTTLNYSNLSDLNPNEIIHLKKGDTLPASFVYSSSTDAVDDDNPTATLICNTDVIILDLKLK